MEEINLKDFYQFYKKYILGVIVACLFCVAVALVYNIFIKTPVYTASTTIVLVKDENDSQQSISQSDILLNQKLISSYSRIVKSRLVLEQVIKSLELDYTFKQLYDEVNVNAVNDTEIMEISVTDKEADKAITIANEIAAIFDKEVKQIYKISNVSIIDAAVLPSKPSNDHLLRDIVLALFVGFVFSSGIIFVVFYFDDTLRDVDLIEKEIKLPVIAKIFKDDSGFDLIVDKKPNASASESIRTLRTNLQFSSVDEELKTILVTSSLPSEGKSFVSANLAISFAQTGKRVLLMDCDLRKGRQSSIFKVNSRKGLSNLLISDIHSYADYIIETKIDNLYVIPKGSIPPNPSELLNSKKNEILIEILKRHFDYIILDGAPIMGLSDSLILGSLVDKTIIVTSINETPKTELINTKKGLESIGAHIAGVVANNLVVTKGMGGYYGYGYYESGYYGETPKKKTTKTKTTKTKTTKEPRTSRKSNIKDIIKEEDEKEDFKEEVPAEDDFIELDETPEEEVKDIEKAIEEEAIKDIDSVIDEAISMNKKDID